MYTVLYSKIIIIREREREKRERKKVQERKIELCKKIELWNLCIATHCVSECLRARCAIPQDLKFF